MMRVFITGGAGFIGSHLCDTLVAEGNDVTILDNLSTGTKKNIAHLEGKIRLIQGDIRNENLVESLVENCDLILHMAAALGVDNILQNPIESISTNYHGSKIVLNAATKFDKRIVIASTSEIYGKNPKQPLVETDDRVVGTPQKLRWTYSDAKALEEATAYYLFTSRNLKVTTVRFFNTVGPRQTGKYGMVIPRFIEAALENKPICVFGDGSQSRVFCHVKDAISGLMQLSANNNAIGEVFNIGGQGEIKIIELAKLIIKKLGSKSEIVFKDYKDAYADGFEDMTRRVPDTSKITTMTNWKPKLSLENIISDVAQDIVKKI
jgi:UDP-glucose 4-epimerase